MSEIFKNRIIAVLLLISGVALGWFVYSSEINKDSNYHFKMGLDLSGGTLLVYNADTTNVAPSDVNDTMMSLRDIIERRVNIFGVSEPLVQTQKSGNDNRLIVELPGVTDTQSAIDTLGKTPVLEFRLEKKEDVKNGTIKYIPTKLTGRYLKHASLQFKNGVGVVKSEPIVGLKFNNDGAEIFAKITKENVGKRLGIFLDGVPISTPTINEEIPGGEAVVSGNFKTNEAKELVRNLNYGALPVKIELLSANTIGASLGSQAVRSGVVAGIYGLIFVAVFLILWYRLSGLIAIISLGTYVIIMFAIFKTLPVTLTAAGIAGFILSIGLAVDANVLIFERTKEEFNEEGVSFHEAVKRGFNRAWTSIRDGNLSSIITAVILFWFGTSMVKGFALVFGIGVVVSMFTAITLTRVFLLSISDRDITKRIRLLFGSGFGINRTNK